MSDLATCINGPRCPGWDGRNAQPTNDPYCRDCLDRAERDIRGLIYDYVDLAQLHEASLSQAPTEHVTGSHESPLLIAGHTEALQAEIVWTVRTWETVLRDLCHLSPAPTRARPGHHVQRGIGIIAARLDRLQRLTGTPVRRTGCEDPIEPVTGVEAITHLQQLHQRARAMLGRTTRRFWIPGECWNCDAHPVRDVDGPLWRSEPKRAEDPMEVHCATCGATRPYPDYETYQQTLLWPGQDTDDLVQAVA
jgi:hypothetical protein